MFKKNAQGTIDNEILNISTNMEGTLKFNNPTNLQINGKFVGTLETKGTLTIGEKADVKAKTIKGENIIIKGKVTGEIICSKYLELCSSAKVTGSIHAPMLIVNTGAMLKGTCEVPSEPVNNTSRKHAKKQV